MNKKLILLLAFSLLFLKGNTAYSQIKQEQEQALQTMLKATRFMVETVSNQGGFVWYYLPDFSRTWGEMEAYPSMIWVQNPGTVSMGNIFLDAYELTHDEYYYLAAEKVANALIRGQNPEGGWNYMIDFAGDRSLRKWYETIGKNGWRLEEFQHYYGNSTFDDRVTSGAARYLLRMYLVKLDPVFKPALYQAIGFILESQYPKGGWPQRFPLKHDFSKNGNPDYTSFYTLNDDVTCDNLQFLIQCYALLGEVRFLEPIERAMNFFVLAQDGGGGWAQQLDMEMKTAGARTYEPAALLPSATFRNAFVLLKCYEFTGDQKYLNAVPAAIDWLERTRLKEELSLAKRYTHPTFVDPLSEKPVFVHRQGSNVAFGRYFSDQNDQQLLAHYGGKTFIPLDLLRDEYNRILSLPVAEVTINSPLLPGNPVGNELLNDFLAEPDFRARDSRDQGSIQGIIQSLDEQGRWLSKHAMISNPYIGDGVNQELTNKFATTFVGDITDTSPFRDTGEQVYISTGTYIRNMKILMDYIQNSNR